ncbi:MAG TPA: DUF296 domain-containing protein [Pseudonocardiaceae bacterium]|nr:DUF296 domain-containing protein [Pseudonocardiaceae bacterium]
MKQAEVVEDADVVTYVVVCDPGDEAVSALSQFARWKLRRSPPSAPSSTRPSVGSTRRPGTYRRIPVDEQCEVLSLIGDVAEGAIGPVPHMHVVLGLSDGTTRGGHLPPGAGVSNAGGHHDQAPAQLRKVMRPDIQIAPSIGTGRVVT